MRSGRDRLLPVPLEELRNYAADILNSGWFVYMRFGNDRLTEFDNGFSKHLASCVNGVFDYLINEVISESGFRAGLEEVINEYCTVNEKSFTGTRFGIDRLTSIESVFSGRLAADAGGVFDYFVSEMPSEFNFYAKFEQTLVNYYIYDKKPFKEFEEAVKAKLPGGQIPCFEYGGA